VPTIHTPSLLLAEQCPRRQPVYCKSSCCCPAAQPAARTRRLRPLRPIFSVNAGRQAEAPRGAHAADARAMISAMSPRLTGGERRHAAPGSGWLRSV